MTMRQRPDAPVQHLPAGMARTDYTDDAGRRWAVLVPVGHEDEAELGIILGPPDLRDTLPDLPEIIAVALHNELYARGLITERDVTGRGGEVRAALQTILRLDVETILQAYHQG